MNRMIRPIRIGLAVTLLSSIVARAGSIWAKAAPHAKMVYADDTAKSVGDTLTIIIKEHSVITNDTTRDNKKETSREAGVEVAATTLGNVLSGLFGRPGWEGKTLSLPTVTAKGSAKHSYLGKGKYETNRKVEDRISVTVEDVLPNGNLVVLGKRRRQIAGDTEIIEVSGIVRPSDVTFANAVDSELVADFHIVHKVNGPETRWTRPGWLGRLLNFLNPS